MPDAYTVLARRYRSQTFDELVGQEAIAQTLKNAIKTNRVAHAFLFTGTRGVGKTSAARILAKAINCQSRAEDGNPCGQCNACKATARGDDIDVIEIDGASNNSVDQIRELRQSAGIRPARSPYKIYIIDEVHMLTGGAFNALLKTLEEPPEHVKFIFATTDIHKVPATIISRCQRFDFKNIPTARIAEHLKQIIKDEGLAAEDEALHRVARLGNGSMRDALSILDRVLSLGEKTITDKLLETLLGKPPTAAIGDLVQALSQGDAAAAITRADALLKEGMGVEQVLGELIEFLRNLMLVATCGRDTELLEVPCESRPIFATLAARYDAPTLVHLMALCEQTLRSLKASTMHRPLFDALIVRLALAEQFTNLRELLATTPAAAHSNPPIAGQKKSSPEHLTPPTNGTRSVSEGEASTHPATSLQGDANASIELPAPPSPLDAPPPEDAPEESIYEVMKQTMARQKEEREARDAAQRQQRPYGRPGAAPASTPAAPPPVAKAANLADLPGVWIAARAYLSDHARLLESVLGACSHIDSLNQQTGELLLLIPNHYKGYANDKGKPRLEEALRAVTGLPVKLNVQFTDQVVAPPPGAATTDGSAAAQRIPPEIMDAVKNQPIVKELMKRLDATVTQVEILEGGPPEL